MQGKDPTNEDEYNKQTLALAQDNIDALNTNGDDKLSVEEYFFTHEVLSEMEKDRTILQTISDGAIIKITHNNILRLPSCLVFLAAKNMAVTATDILMPKNFKNIILFRLYYLILEHK